jgi:two-component system phosphate regulon sensor histidine kinase PhoR
MLPTFRLKVLAIHVVLVLLVVLLVMIELHRALALDLQAQLRDRLESQAAGAVTWMHQNRHPEKLVRRLAAVIDARVEILDPSGAVLADSESIEDGPAGPPVDPTTAQVVTAGDEALTMRLSAPLTGIDVTVAKMRERLLYASLLAVLAAVLLGVLASRLATRPLRSMMRAAQSIARGQYDIELPPASPDEFGALATSLAELAAQLKRDMARIEQLERVRRDFVANVSHELRTPVTTIQGYAETLLDGGADAAETRAFLEAVHRHAARLSGLVASLLNLSALEARSQEDAVRERVEVRAIADHVAAAALKRAGRKDDRIEVAVPEELHALGDPTGVEQVLENLVDNALRYGGGDVRVEGAQGDGRVVLRVRDAGRIDPEHLPRLFERFYRVDAGRSRAHGGAGLGLAIVKHLCETMDGAVRVESTADRGTTFTVELPAA